MLYALSNNGERSLATPKACAICPGCRADLIPKCGQINIWHWAHKTKDCDPWYEPESQWHLYWKSLVSKENCEVVMPPHRADIVTPDKTVVELQHSSIDSREISERENFYKNIIWLIDAKPFESNLDFRRKANYHTFAWKHGRRSQAYMHRLIWDFGDRMFSVKRFYPPEKGEWIEDEVIGPYQTSSKRGGGWGRFIDRGKFISWLGGANR